MLLVLSFCLNVSAENLLQTMKRLPDTGQQKSYTNTFGEDSDFNINPQSFVKVNNFITIDTVTGLMWQRIDGGEMTWENAKIYCDTLTLGGFSDWRLPEVGEAFSILNFDKNNPPLDTNYFAKTAAEYWWAMQKQANDSTRI